jgi:hypothetical protein
MSRVSDDPIEHAWERVVAQWESEPAHKAFLTLASSTSRLAEAGRRYREVAEREPERAEVAKRQIERVTALAMQNLATLKSEPAPPSRKLLLVGIATVLTSLMLLSALWTLLRSK